MLAAADISNKKHKNKEKGFYFHRNPRIFYKNWQLLLRNVLI